MGRVGWVVPVRNGAGVHMGVVGGVGRNPSHFPEKRRLREGRPMSEVTQLRDVEQRLNTLSLQGLWPWSGQLLGQDRH